MQYFSIQGGLSPGGGNLNEGITFPSPRDGSGWQEMAPFTIIFKD